MLDRYGHMVHVNGDAAFVQSLKKARKDRIVKIALAVVGAELHARETLYQATKSGPPCPGLTARSNPGCVTLSMWHQGLEMVATLTRAQSETLARTIASQSGNLQIACPVRQFNTSTAS